MKKTKEMKVGDLVRANEYAPWSAREAKIALVVDYRSQGMVRVLIDGKHKTLVASHFEVISGNE